MKQEIWVYIILIIALVYWGRHMYLKWRILLKSKKDLVCADCPLKEKCNSKTFRSESADSSCHMI